METLTKSEEKIMQILWKLKKGFVKDVIEKMPEPKPAYNTVSSIIRILVNKGFVDYKAYGKTHEYFPKISKMAYKKKSFRSLIKNYFDGSYKNVVSYMVSEEKVSEQDIEEMKKIIEKFENKN